MTARDVAKRALIEKAILDELSQANSCTRNELTAQDLQPGDRVSVDDLGYVLMTQPKPVYKVTDWTVLTKWIEDHAADWGLVIQTSVSQSWVKRVLADGGEWTDPETGEIFQVPGLGMDRSAPQLRVVPSDQAAVVARDLLGVTMREVEQ